MVNTQTFVSVTMKTLIQCQIFIKGKHDWEGGGKSVDSIETYHLINIILIKFKHKSSNQSFIVKQSVLHSETSGNKQMGEWMLMQSVYAQVHTAHEQDTDSTLEFISISISILFKSISITVSHVCNPVCNNIKWFPWSELITKEKRELEKRSWFENLIWDAVVHTDNETIRSANAKINTSIIECVHSLSHHPHKVNYRALFISAHFFCRRSITRLHWCPLPSFF